MADEELVSLLTSIREKAGGVEDKAKSLLAKVNKGALPTSSGISLLEMKNQLLLSYCLQLAHLMSIKAEGRSIEGHAVVDRLIYLRTLFERIRPLDKKIKYQVDKVIKLATSEQPGSAGHDPLRFKPNPAAMQSQSEDAAKPSSDAKYRPPKMTAVSFEEDERQSKEERRKARERRQMLASEMLREMRSDVLDAPEEIQEAEASGVHYLQGKKRKHDDVERQQFEEDNFVRLTVGKKKNKRKNPTSGLHDIADFGSFSAYQSQDNDVVPVVKRTSMRDKIRDAKQPKVRRKSLMKRVKRSSAPSEEPS